jgi:hypothetical protein
MVECDNYSSWRIQEGFW